MTALVLGIVGAVFSWIPVLGLILAVLAVVFGALGYARARKGQATNSGMAIAGLVLGIIAFVIQIVILAAMSSAANQVSKDLHNLPAPFPPSAAAPAQPVQSGPLTSFGDGTYAVGKEVLPGSYKTSGSTINGLPCYWGRLKDTSGKLWRDHRQRKPDRPDHGDDQPQRRRVPDHRVQHVAEGGLTLPSSPRAPAAPNGWGPALRSDATERSRDASADLPTELW
ncbi:MAG TPA: DUF4190 domain-containing protein [Pseudonocardiaceae bacterium]